MEPEPAKNQVSTLKLEDSWKRLLHGEFEKPYMQKLKKFLVSEIQKKQVLFPKADEYFAAMNLVPFEKVKVVILGQDPYHGRGQAHGLCFSVRPGVPLPPSLKNIFKELKKDLGIDYPDHGCLEHWARQGVLLLNSTLTVREGRAGSHQNQGWEAFTDQALSLLSEKREGLVYLLWGSYAAMKGQFLDAKNNLVLKAPHPSPFSAERGFFGCRHFSKANQYLCEKGQIEIDWALPRLASLKKS